MVACWCLELWWESGSESASDQSDQSDQSDPIDGMDPKAKPAAVLFLLALLCKMLRLHCSWSLLRSTSQRSETLGRGELSYGFQPLPKGVPVLALSFCLLLNATNATKATNAKSLELSDSSNSEFFKYLRAARVVSWCAARCEAWQVEYNPLSKSWKTARLTGWQGHFLSCEYHKDCPLCILNISRSHNEANPAARTLAFSRS